MTPAVTLPEGVTVFERGWLSSNNVLLVGPDNVALVDSGYCTHAQQTLDLVARAIGGRELTKLLNTHLHSDHCGGNAALQLRYLGVETLIPPGLADAVRRWDTQALTYAPTGQQCPRFTFNSTMLPGTEVRLGKQGWQVHAAPGHDPHSVVLFEPATRTLISADALWEHGFGVVFPELEGASAFDEVGRTLDLIERLAPRTVIPGHGAVFTDCDAALERARGRLAAYRQDPLRHAAHAAKVLLKFKLLELQVVARADFDAWARSTQYFQLVHARSFADTPREQWISGLLADLARSGAARLEGDLVLNA